MTKNIVSELRGALISDDEFIKWKSSWNPSEPIPEVVHQYVNQVLLKKLNDSFNDLDSMTGSL